MSGQRIVFDGNAWSCAWCAAELHDAAITHKPDCRWIAEVRAQGAATERARIRERLADHVAAVRNTWGDVECCSATLLADLLDGDDG